MKRTAPAHLPRIREYGLVIDDLPDEVLVYDLDRHEAHCLNHSAALVWRACDGNLTPAEIARKLSAELDAEFSEGMVLLALGQLERIHLLVQPEILSTQFAVLSRRQLVRHLGLAAAVAAPLVISIVAPTPVQAASCIPTGSPCSPTVLCCSPLGCNPGTGKCR